MSLLPVLTTIGRNALIEAQLGSTSVVLSTVSLGSQARAPTGQETAVLASFASGPITSSSIDTDAGRIDLSVLIDGAAINLVGDHPVREIGFLDGQGRLIFYWSTLGTLGSLTPETAYALTFSVALAPADAQVIEIVDSGPPWEILFETRLAAVEAKLDPGAPLSVAQTELRQAAWRNLFLAFN